MELQPKCHAQIEQLVKKGVVIPNPSSLDIGDEVNQDNISARDVTIYPGCRIYGEKTVISAGAKIGREGPVTIDNCWLGPKVELRGGYFKGAVFLEKASVGLGAHIREGCILEEEASGAHCVGLKQTILFPFVTLGSLINFCDCLMAGGTSRRDHSEVGSSYIHFNYTPDGDKATASLIGDVPRGVMLNQPPIFLGGQGGLIGPARIGYGNVVVAGSILRKDYPEDRKLIVGKTHPETVIDFVPGQYRNIGKIVGTNIRYLANLAALGEWYKNVRHPFFNTQEFGDLMYKGLSETLAGAKKERMNRLRALTEKAAAFSRSSGRQESPGRKELSDNFARLEELFAAPMEDESVEERRHAFLTSFQNNCESRGANYIEVIKALPTQVSTEGTSWLQRIVDVFCEKAGAIVPSLSMFGR